MDMDFEFSPQLIQFVSQEPEAEDEQGFGFGQSHFYLVQEMDALSFDSPWRNQMEYKVLITESLYRTEWFQKWLDKLQMRFRVFIDKSENPDDWKSTPALSAHQLLVAELLRLRSQLHEELMPLLPASSEPSALQRYLTAQLTKLDAVRMKNGSAYEKSREVAAPYKQQLMQMGILPEEVLVLLKFDRLLDSIIAYHFTWERALKSTRDLESHLSKLQKIALAGLRPIQAEMPTVDGAKVWSQQNGKLLNELGISWRCFKATYADWIKQGLYYLQLAIKQDFDDFNLLLKSVECFYSAHSLEPDQVEALVYLAWMMILMNQSNIAVDCLEMAMRQRTLPEMKDLFWLVQSLDPTNQLLPSLRKTVAHS